MSVLAIVAALLLEQWHPLGERKAWSAVLGQGAQWLEAAFNAGEHRHGMIAWIIAVAPAVAAAAGLHAFLYWVHPLFALLFNVAVLYLTLGFRQFSHYFSGVQEALRDADLERARGQLGAWRSQASGHCTREEVIRLSIEEALASSHRQVFGVLFWFVLLPGPSGAVLYRLATYLERRWGGLGAFGGFAQRARDLLEWPAVRMTAAAFAVVGDFEDAVYCWRTQATAWSDRAVGAVLAAGAGALGVRLGMPLTTPSGLEPRPELGIGEVAEAQHLDSAVGLLWRTLVLWVFVLAVFTALRVL